LLQAGGSLRSIAAAAGISVDALLLLNPEILDPNKVVRECLQRALIEPQ
jgi:hypothetical protein